MVEESNKSFYVVAMTGLLAVTGTVAGGVVEGYWQTELAQQEFQSDLILKALESNVPEERKQSLQFLVDAGLIQDQAMSVNLAELLSREDVVLPQFGEAVVAAPVNPGAADAAEDLGIKDDPLSGFWVLTGLDVRHGDIVDGFSPIFTKVKLDGSLDEATTGQRYGGGGGKGTRLTREGYIITGLNLRHGIYFGAKHIIHLEVVWQRLGRDGTEGAEVVSQRMGGGNYAKNLGPWVKHRAQPGQYISSLKVPGSVTHTSGETYATDVIPVFRPWPL